MKLSERALHGVIDSFYAAALGEEDWQGALRSMADFMGGAGGAVFELNRQTGRISDWNSYGLGDEGTNDYIAHVNSINPRMKFSLGHAAGHVAWDGRFISDRAMDRHEFYAWAKRVSGVRYFIGSRLHDDGDNSAFASVEFTHGQGHATQTQIETFGILAKHVGNARRVWARRTADDAVAGAKLISDQLPWGILTLDRDGSIIEINRRGQIYLARHDGLSTHARQLIALKSADNRKLRSQIAAALKVSERPSIRSGGGILISRPNDRPSYVLQIIPLARKDHRQSVPAAVVYISDPCDTNNLTAKPLMTIFGLSQREADLATALRTGENLSQAADILGIARNTARNHLQNVLRKTRCHSQVDLARLLARLVAPDPTEIT